MISCKDILHTEERQKETFSLCFFTSIAQCFHKNRKLCSYRISTVGYNSQCLISELTVFQAETIGVEWHEGVQRANPTGVSRREAVVKSQEGNMGDH